jgi:hypothetical protein
MRGWRRTWQGDDPAGSFADAAAHVVVAVPTAAAVVTLLCLALAAPAASANSCPNERLRHESNIDPVSREAYSAMLSDCRAYELVTPPFKFGLAPVAGPTLVGDGSHLVIADRGAFAETGSNEGTLGAEYVLGRGEAAGWAATAVDMPGAQFNGSGGAVGQGELVDVSRDFGRGLIGSVPIGSTPGSIESKPVNPRFYIREPNSSAASCASGAIAIVDACLLEVGPAVPPATVQAWKAPFEHGAQKPTIVYRGASPDLGHVLFSSKAKEAKGDTSWLWPGDTTTERESLYELSGVAGTPRLVGLGNGPQPELISQCGTDLGSLGSENTHNAIAAQGNIVFFTAREGGCPSGGTGPRVNELYARIGASATVAISEPSLSVPGRECTGLCREDENEENGHQRSQGVFVGASEDGSKVFFLTRQPLVNGDEEGTGTGQDLYEAELEGGAIKRLVQVSHDPNAGEAAEVQGVLRTSEEGSRVYFVAHGVLAGNTDAKGEKAVVGAENLYVYEPDPATPGQFKAVFIATLPEGDESDWGFGEGGGGAGQVEVTPKTPTGSDGRFLLLASRGDLTPDTTAGEASRQLYRFDAEQERLVRVSIDENFTNSQEESEFLAREESRFEIQPPTHGTRSLAGPAPVAISDDGAYVFFQSETALTPRALNKQVAGCHSEEAGRCTETIYARNIYEYHEGHVYLISDGQDRHAVEGASAVNLIGASPSGADVYFTTADPLVPQDTDTQADVYDARIDGGFPAPAAPAPCQPDHCQGELSPPPSLQSPGSLAFSGPGDLPAPAGEPTTKPPSKTKPLTRAQKRKRALRACSRYRNRRKRNACVRRVDKRYGARSSAKQHHRATHGDRRAK